MVFMLTVTVVWISVVSGLHLTTQERVRRNESLYLKRAIMQAVNVPVPESGEEVAAWYDQHVTAVPDEDEPEYYEVSLPNAGGEHYAFPVSGSGLWGTIRAVVGLEDNLRTLAGASFLSHNETPGLGARISEDWFTDQLVGKTPPIELVPEDTESEDPSKIDAVTGATITSTAVRNMLNRTVDLASAKLKDTE